jgi:hypothetical protein
MTQACRTFCTTALIAALVMPSASPAWAASPDVGALQGAWAQKSVSCEDIFVATKRGMAFRKPVNIFAPAILIAGRRLTTAGATCKIRSISPVGERLLLSLSCATSIAVEPVKAQLSLAEDGSLNRYSDDNDSVGSSYVRCGR